MTKKKSHPYYGLWCNMKSRCLNKNSAAYSRYGGRGIKICDRWLNNFWNFVQDMGDRPSPEHSLERIDNYGDYCPDNCKWATSLEQNSNKRNNVVLEINGHKLHVAEWSRKTGVPAKIIYQRLSRGASPEEAVKKESLRPATKLISFKGKKQSAEKWSKELGIPANTIRHRQNRGWEPKDILKQGKKVNQFDENF